MGLYDVVDLTNPPPCPGCGASLAGEEWQTKDTECPYLEHYREDQLDEAGICNFYTSCPACNGWVEFRRRLTQNLAAFDLTFEAHVPYVPPHDHPTAEPER